MNRALYFLIPGDLQTLSGGYLYDRRMVGELRRHGWHVSVTRLDESFPEPDSAALEHADRSLGAIPPHSLVLVDGLAFGAMPQILQAHARRLQLVALMHMPLAAEPGIESERARHRQRLEREALQSARHVIVTGQAMTAAWGRDPALLGKISVIEPGTDERPLATRHAGNACVNLLCVGPISHGKGQLLLIEVLASLAGMPWQLCCVGSLTRSPDSVAALQARLQQLGLSDRVALIGEVSPERLSGHFLQADLFVLATRFESYCMAVAEALAHGLPVVSTLTGEIAELVGTQAGLLVPVGDVAGLRAALARVLSEPALLAALAAGAAARRPQLRRRWQEAGEQLVKLLMRLDARAGRP